MRVRITPGFLLGLMLLLAIEATAHHSFNFFKSEDGERFVIAEGTISDIRLANPHSGVFIDVVDENGDVEAWGLETRPYIFLSRRGWTQETLRIGQRVTFSGERLRTTNRAWWRALLVHGASPEADARLFIELEALDALEAEAFEARFSGLPACEDVGERCYRVGADRLRQLQMEYGGEAFLAPGR